MGKRGEKAIIAEWQLRAAERHQNATRAGSHCDNSSQQSGVSDKSTIQSGKSLREQELETMVNKLSTENAEIKHSHQVTLAAQQELIDTNNRLLDQLSQVQTQLSTVKDDMRQEFDHKFNLLFKMITGPRQSIPPIMAPPFHSQTFPIPPPASPNNTGMPAPHYYFPPPIHYTADKQELSTKPQDLHPQIMNTPHTPLDTHLPASTVNGNSHPHIEPKNLSEARTDQTQHVG